MEALMVVSEHRNHHHRNSGGVRSRSRGYCGVNCRSFHAAAYVGGRSSPPLPPTRSYSSPEPPARTYSSPDPKTPKQLPRQGGKRTRPISISPSTSPPPRAELWAGPGFSNSPPPSSLPIPKFSLRQKRSISLELPPVKRSDDVKVQLHAKSAPSSPVGGSGNDFFSSHETAVATENLRRILQLNIADN